MIIEKCSFVFLSLIAGLVSFAQNYFDDPSRLISRLNKHDVVNHLQIPKHGDSLFMIDERKMFMKSVVKTFCWNGTTTYVESGDSIIFDLNYSRLYKQYKGRCNYFILSYWIQDDRYYNVNVVKPCLNEMIQLVYLIKRKKKLKFIRITRHVL